MTTPVPALSGYQYGHLTVPAETVDCHPGPQPAIPRLSDPTNQPLVRTPRPEPLIPVTDTNVLDLGAYQSAGWDHALPVSLARIDVANRLTAAANSLPDGYGLAVFDAYRPLSLQQAIYDAAYADPTLPAGFVSVPSVHPTTPPPHATGGTVDCTLTYAGQPLALGTEFDDFTPAAHAAAFETTPGAVRDLRRLLFHAMSDAGFVVIPCEWWHFEYGTRRWAAITNQPPLYGPAPVDGTVPAAA